MYKIGVKALREKEKRGIADKKNNGLPGGSARKEHGYIGVGTGTEEAWKPDPLEDCLEKMSESSGPRL